MICVCKSIKTTKLVQACSSFAMLEQHGSSRLTRSSRLARQSQTCRVELSQVEFGLISACTFDCLFTSVTTACYRYFFYRLQVTTQP